MHGIIHSELGKFIRKLHGFDVLNDILRQAGLAEKIYLASRTYPDEETMTFVTAAAEHLGRPLDELLEEFGAFMAPDLMEMYQSLLKPEWKTMEMLLATEETIHRVVRMKSPGAEPPELEFRQTGERSLSLFYNSPRRMSAVARGMIRAVAEHYGERAVIMEWHGPEGDCRMDITII